MKTQKCFRGSYKIFPSSLSEANFSPPPHKLLAPPPVMVTVTAPLPVTVMETELLVVTVTVTEPMPATVIRSVSSLGRYVFGSEISYNKAPPRLPGLGC